MELKQALEDLALVNQEVSRLNDMLMSSRQAVEDARLTKEAFVANVSHELRTPLNMIIGFSNEILQRPGVYATRLPDRLLADVSAIHRNSEHLAGLVDDILDLAEAESGNLRLLYETTTMAQIISEAIEQVRLLFEKKDLYLVTRIQAALPAFECDRERIRQVVLNILSNAGRFTETGGTTVRISREDQMLRISIRDTGPGVSRDAVRRLFQPFQQADPTIRRKQGGTGLGLSISKRLVEMHGGEIWMESELGKGTTVHFTLPLRRPALVDPAKRWFGPYGVPSERTRTSKAPQADAPPLLVVVEEGRTLSQLIGRHLDRWEPRAVATLAEARRLVDDGVAASVLVNSRDTDGRTVLEAFGSARFDVPIFMCSMPDLYAGGRALDAKDYLIKPVLSEQLRETMTRVAPRARVVLLVDDDLEALQLFTRMLQGMEVGYVVHTAGDGVEALAIMRAVHPDLVLLDLVMPRLDGFAVLREKMADSEIRDIPVVLVTARDPEYEPVLMQRLTVMRAQGLSRRELAQGIEMLTQVLRPRFGAPALPETPVP